MMTADQELKVSRLTKRSQNKKFFTRDNYKLREFVLTPIFLKYYDVNGGHRGREKGRLSLGYIKFVEKVNDDELDSKKNVFQVAYVEDCLSSNRFLLYIVAASAAEREDWISLIRFYTKERNALFLPRYHPGVWRKPGRYSCCDAINRRSMGCQMSSAPGAPDRDLNVAAAVKIAAAAVAGNTTTILGGGGMPAVSSVATSLATMDTSRVQQQQVVVQQQQIAQQQMAVVRSRQHQPSDSFEMNGDDAENTVIAIHNYNPVRENQLQLQKGERYTVVDSSNTQWWYVRNVAAKAGYVPTNYIQKPNSLTTFDWYYKDLTRQQAESILLEENREGCFLVRDSVSKKNTLTLSVTSRDPESPTKLKVHHYHIHRKETNGTGTNYYLSEKHPFSTVSDVIHYHKHNSGGLVVRLRSPPTKDRECPVTAGMGLDEFELDPAEMQMEPEAIGKGQFGVVRRGLFRGMQVAVKHMGEGAMNEDDFIEEAKNMRFLNHSNLVQLFGVVLKKRPIMIITEYMKYGSLRDFLKGRNQTYSTRPLVLADMLVQVATGMDYLEREQFVHRDLAARNCLVKSVSRRSVQVKVADFGMARFLLDNVYEPSAGTKFPVRWAPPEVFQSTYTAKADVWSFGVLMWEAFTCCTENPYHGMNNAQVYQFIVGGGRLTKPAICPDRLYVLMLECWQHDPQKRPAFEYICQKIADHLDLKCDN